MVVCEVFKKRVVEVVAESSGRVLLLIVDVVFVVADAASGGGVWGKQAGFVVEVGVKFGQECENFEKLD